MGAYAVVTGSEDVDVTADLSKGIMLGNCPQTFVHAAFRGAVLDLKAAGDRQYHPPLPNQAGVMRKATIG